MRPVIQDVDCEQDLIAIKSPLPPAAAATGVVHCPTGHAPHLPRVKGLFPSNSSFKSPGPVAAAEFVFERKITKRTKRRGFSNYSSHSSFPLFPLRDFEQKITKKTKVSEFVGPFISLFVFVSFCWKSACTREAIRFSYSLFVSFC
jgi:hypothetical protein